MSTTDSVELRFDGAIARVHINRPKQLNSLDEEILKGLLTAFQELQSHCQGDSAYQKCRVVVVSGEGEKAFVAGADIKLMLQADAETLRSFISLGQSLMREIEHTPLPVVAMVDGFALGGGLELALACDLIFASERSQLGLPEIGLGLIPGFGGTQRLAARCGRGTAKRLVFTGEMISAAEAKSLGVIDWLCADAELEKQVLATAGLLASRGPLALAAAKRTVDEYFDEELERGLAVEVEQFLRLSTTGDAKEGLEAFVEKRAPAFQGK